MPMLETNIKLNLCLIINNLSKNKIYLVILHKFDINFSTIKMSEGRKKYDSQLQS